MRQLDLFQPVENIKPQTDTANGKVNGGVNIMPVQQEKNTPVLIEPKPARIVEIKEGEKKEKPHLVQKEPIFNGKRGRKSFKEMDADIVMVEVPDDETLFQKKYYAISEVAQWFHVNASLLRYWENEFDVLKPRKTRKGDRLFRPEDVKNLQLIYFLLRQRKFSIEGAKQYLKENKKKADVQMQLIQSLTKFKTFLLEWKTNLGV
jgi:DNA-binding transcriptional MerR regulator